MKTQRELVAEVSVEQLPSQEPVVDPDRALLWLSPGDRHRPGTPDDRFLASETFAAARSVALLTRSPVLNRPSAVSLCGTFPLAPALAVRRARDLDPEANVRPERFTSTWDAGTEPSEVYDYATAQSSFGPAPGSTGPFRRRAAVDGASVVKVRVVGERTISTADVAPATLAASCGIASWYQLDMATLWWLISKDDGARTLARIDCWAFDAGLDADVPEVAEAVVDWMTQRLEQPAGDSR